MITNYLFLLKKPVVAGGWWVGWGRAQPNQPTNSNEARSQQSSSKKQGKLVSLS
jgi:hypothetical protein